MLRCLARRWSTDGLRIAPLARAAQDERNAHRHRDQEERETEELRALLRIRAGLRDEVSRIGRASVIDKLSAAVERMALERLGLPEVMVVAVPKRRRARSCTRLPPGREGMSVDVPPGVGTKVTASVLAKPKEGDKHAGWQRPRAAAHGPE